MRQPLSTWPLAVTPALLSNITEAIEAFASRFPERWPLFTPGDNEALIVFTWSSICNRLEIKALCTNCLTPERKHSISIFVKDKKCTSTYMSIGFTVERRDAMNIQRCCWTVADA
ncbi:hypothetical protein GOP47_0003657 [Adiantum capillus-veneris]|uniref:Uncharacterized protein n=1 Tax=Adiantum capillus-veneris TaxID=13818 RepID=A0A9D4V640_ADICA|nr:hypothetical protein GOP47_0003657 [Adiantum capillus-veneris]